jgi:hypothetical protein
MNSLYPICCTLRKCMFPQRYRIRGSPLQCHLLEARRTNLLTRTGLYLLSLVGWDWVHLVRRPLIGLLYQPQIIDDECGAVGGIRICRGNRSNCRKPAPVPLCPPQIPHDLTRARTRAAAVGSQRLTAWALARPASTRIVLYAAPTPSHKHVFYCDVVTVLFHQALRMWSDHAVADNVSLHTPAFSIVFRQPRRDNVEFSVKRLCSLGCSGPTCG